MKVYKEDKQQLLLKQILTLNQVATSDPKFDILKLKKEDFGIRNKFVLALAKELERKGRIPESIVIYSHIRNNYDEVYSNFFVWKTPRKVENYWGDFFDEYTYYIDFISKASDLEKVIKLAKSNCDHEMYRFLIRDLPKLYDLLGTKYLRYNKLKKAQKNYELAGEEFYMDKSNPFHYYLNANPFYADINSAHRVTKADTVSYTKPQIIRKLREHLAVVKSAKNKTYHYNQIANCYLNMTYHGNSWMMRRYAWSQENFDYGLEDETEYQEANLAKKYYLKAYRYCKDSDLAPYYLAMAGKCEQFKISRYYDIYDHDVKLKKNSYYVWIDKMYSEWGQIRLGGCYAYDRTIYN